MGEHVTLPVETIRDLRESHYNATIAKLIVVHDELRILRIVPDLGNPHFEPGEYLSLGMGNWEPRAPATQPELLTDAHLRKLCKRAYSISCSLAFEDGRLLRVSEYPYLEFYISLVRSATRHPPALTPRLFMVGEGARLHVSPQATGHYNLAAVRPDADVFFFATGTGEAPHNAMIAELLAREHRGRIVNAVCVRRFCDAPYCEVHQELVRRYSNYSYILLTTREPENLNAAATNYAGKKYLQDIVQSGELEERCGVPLVPSQAQVFLCGNPEMIGAPKRGASNTARAALPSGMLGVLMSRGFKPDFPGQAGNVHFEGYW